MSKLIYCSDRIKGNKRFRQYFFDNRRGQIKIVKAYNKEDVKKAFKASNQEIMKHCRILPYDETRKIDVDLTKKTNRDP